jgi:hypothetical protein
VTPRFRLQPRVTLSLVTAALLFSCFLTDIAEAGGRRGGRGRGRAGRGGPPTIAPRSDFEAAYLKWNTPYKRALLATKGGNAEGAGRMLARARVTWYGLLYRHWENPPAQFAGDEDWRRDLATITGYLHVAESLAQAGGMYAAHDALEPIRSLWLDMRERNEIPWFGDQLTRYHDIMEPLVAWGTGDTGRYVTPDNIDEFEQAYAQLETAWRELTRAPMPRGNTRRFMMLMRQEGKAVADLQQAIHTRNWGVIPEVCEELKAAFVPLFMGFG